MYQAGDWFYGGTDDDILIGGIAAYSRDPVKPVNLPALNAISSEWARTGLVNFVVVALLFCCANQRKLAEN